MTKQRIEYIDLARGFAILCVVMGHYFYDNGQRDNIWCLLIYSFHMPLFFYISGYVAEYTHDPFRALKSAGIFVWRKFLGLMLPWIVWTFVVHQLFFTDAVATIRKMEHMGIGDMIIPVYWFLPCLFILTICGMLFHLATDAKKKQNACWDVILSVIIFAVIVVAYMAMKSGTMKDVFCFYPFYFFGILTRRYKLLHCVVMESKTAYTVSILVFCVASGLYISYSGSGLLYVALPKLLAGISAIVSIMRIFANVKFPTWIHRQLELFGRNTLGIYLLHFTFITPMVIYSTSLFLSLVEGVIVSLAVTYLCIGIIMMIKRNSTLALILLGIRTKNIK